MQQLGVCSGPKSATHHQSIPKPNSLKGIKGFSPTTHDRAKGETKTIKLQKFTNQSPNQILSKESKVFHQQYMIGEKEKPRL
jgi:hypothetical protein